MLLKMGNLPGWCERSKKEETRTCCKKDDTKESVIEIHHQISHSLSQMYYQTSNLDIDRGGRKKRRLHPHYYSDFWLLPDLYYIQARCASAIDFYFVQYAAKPYHIFCQRMVDSELHISIRVKNLAQRSFQAKMSKRYMHSAACMVFGKLKHNLMWTLYNAEFF